MKNSKEMGVDPANEKKYSLNVGYYKKSFDSLDDLIEDVMYSGMDPNVQILRDGKKTGEKLIDYLQF